MQHNGQMIASPTLSLGVAAYPDNGSTSDEVLRAADAALYRAKGEGRNQVAVAG
jgi:diguanylate cyclase (GGDEF)-like protein